MRRKRFYVLTGLSWLCAGALLCGCGTVPLLDPKGPVGEAERFVILAAFGLMLIVVIPVFIMAFWFARKYRASNTQSDYAPKWDYSGKIDLMIWLVPVAIIIALGTLSWETTHRLDPFRPLASEAKPITIEAVAMDWKWLFIYPDYHIATVNEIVFPAQVPVSFRITSDTVMSSFFIPRLGSQIYAMAGMETRLHLLADEPGVYDGHNQQFSGQGYANMHFDAIAGSQAEFDAWVEKTRNAPDQLDLARYRILQRPTLSYPVTYFSSVAPDLFMHIIHKYRPGVDMTGAVRDPGGRAMETLAVEGR